MNTERDTTAAGPRRRRAAAREKTLINISKRTFIQVSALLLGLMIVAIVLTYVIPKGAFGTLPDGSTDYSSYTVRDDIRGVNILKGIFAPILVFFSDDGLTLIMLSLFLLVISSAFQVMNDVGGIRSLVDTVSVRFRKRRTLLVILIAFVFMCFGAFLGLFEEMLTMLPIVTLLCVSVGLDSFTGFLITIGACGFGFASAITNPFTVLLASEIIGANPMEHIWYRLIIFAVMFLLLIGFVLLYMRRIIKRPEASLTYVHDRELRLVPGGEAGANAAADTAAAGDTVANAEPAGGAQVAGTRKIRLTYIVFLLVALALIIVCSALPAVRGYTVPVLTAYFLIFGLVAGVLACGSFKKVIKSFLGGLVGALPTLVFIALAASIKYIFDEGSVMPTLVHQINDLAAGKSVFAIALIIYLIVLVLEFFISSSTAKAVLVMGLLGVVNVGLSEQMRVLLYTFADGYTNVLFPTSPVLLIGLSMIGVDYFKWIKKSWALFAVNTALVVGFILLGIVIGY